jgi:hypothetical protein
LTKKKVAHFYQEGKQNEIYVVLVRRGIAVLFNYKTLFQNNNKVN